jgi:hypothetical protein
MNDLKPKRKDNRPTRVADGRPSRAKPGAKVGGARKGAGAKPWKVTEEQRIRVSTMVACGYRIEDIRRVIKTPKGREIGAHTFIRKFSTDVEAARALLVARVSERVFDKAMGNGPDSMRACELILRCMAGWQPPAPPRREPEHHMHGRFSEETPTLPAPEQVQIMTLDDFYAERIAADAIAAAATGASGSDAAGDSAEPSDI